MVLSFAALFLVALVLWRWRDKHADQEAWNELASRQPSAPDIFDPSMISGLPAAAQRFFLFAIKPGAPLYCVAEISMQGEFSLGSKSKPNYMPMVAEQILAAPYGFVWKLSAGNAGWISGSDGATDRASWSRFWLLGVIPVARAGGNTDHARSAFGRFIAEAVFWTPAALLVDNNAHWESIDNSTARVTLTRNGFAQAVDLTVEPDGRLSKVVFQRWSNANPDKVFQLQPFGGYLSEYKEFDGFNLPTRIDAGNFFETENYFPFYRVNVTALRFPR